ncbi:hypothetical protein ISO36_04300 [Morganella morganii subsp. morganii]|uniref:hypothetical protein n=1 Tax=Morganella morganii TaxID=582 RepID=UPI001BDB1DCE|nr:hypothetical protein [Morganella morganii]MBT0369638.1 hypothetical protein [Morganella morganii subsp. morganii]
MANHPVFATPADIIRPIAAALETAQFLALDPLAKDLASDLVAWAQETAALMAVNMENEKPEAEHA